MLKISTIVLLFLSFIFFLKCAPNSGDKIVISSEAELGHFLFYDRDLSFDSKTSCASCHDPKFAFTDTYRLGQNGKGKQLDFNTPSVLNLGSYSTFGWELNSDRTLAEQISRAFLAEEPVEMGWAKDSFAIKRVLSEKYEYQDHQILDFTLASIIRSLESYLNELESRNSYYDLGQDGESTCEVLERLECTTCHGGKDFNVTQTDKAKNLKYRVPSLRNLKLTEPYFHDGRYHTLSDAILAHKDLEWESTSENVLLPEDKSAIRELIECLETLTDTSYFHEPYFFSPFKTQY